MKTPHADLITLLAKTRAKLSFATGGPKLDPRVSKLASRDIRRDLRDDVVPEALEANLVEWGEPGRGLRLTSKGNAILDAVLGGDS